EVPQRKRSPGARPCEGPPGRISLRGSTAACRAASRAGPVGGTSRRRSGLATSPYEPRDDCITSYLIVIRQGCEEIALRRRLNYASHTTGPLAGTVLLARAAEAAAVVVAAVARV